MSFLLRRLIDVSVALGLLAALVAVYRWDQAAAQKTDKEQAQLTRAGESAGPRPLRLAVTRGKYDDMGKLLTQLGEGYAFTPLDLEDLADADKLSSYDVVFATCGTHPPAWVGAAVREGDRPDTELRQWNPAVVERLRASLQKFVGDGGTLYASDFQRPVVEKAFPQFARGAGAEQGVKQSLTARVMDAGLRDLVGPQLPLHFQMDGWYPAALNGPRATVYLQAEYRTMQGQAVTAPLLVKIPYKQGTIIFTSFHNEEQNQEAELKLLQYLVFSAVTAKVEARLAQEMYSGGFSPRKQSLLSASDGVPSVTQSYQHAKPGRLRFVVGFENQGAQLRLAVTGPDGKQQEQEGSSTFTVEVPEAPAGEWRYTLTAVKVPYRNFPFRLMVGAETPAGAGKEDEVADNDARGEPRPESLLVSPYARRTLGNREEWITRYGGSRESERAVVEGLNWLARHQAADGSWNNRCLGGHAEQRCEAGPPCQGEGGVYEMAHTGLALLAFQAGGHYATNKHQYSDAVRRGLDWLVKKQRADGALVGSLNPPGGFHPHHMYEHGIATFALGEACAVAVAYRQTPEPAYLDTLRKAVQFIERHQYTDGGWRYGVDRYGQGDASVSGWQVLALKTAKAAGVEVAPACVERTEQFFKGLETGQDGRTGYVGRVPATDATTGVGMLVHQFLLNKPDAPLVRAAAPYLAGRAEAGSWGPRAPDYYLWYNCTLALFQAGGKPWERWNKAVRDVLVGLQEHKDCARGSWPPNDPWSAQGGRIYSTALAVLTLEVYYRFTSKNE